MIDVLNEYGLAFLYSDGYRLTGLVITLWLTVISVFAGFALALPMSMPSHVGMSPVLLVYSMLK